MVALPAVPKVVRVDHHFTQGSTANLQVREFFQYSGTLSVPDAGTWLNNIVTGLTTNLLDVLSNTLSLTGSELTDLTSTSSAQVLSAVVGTGGNTNAELDAATAMVISKHISRRYRGGHPRIYIPGTVQAWLGSPNRWNSTGLNLVLTNYVLYIQAATSVSNPAAIGAIQHVNVSYYSGFVNHTYPSGRVKAIPQLRVTPLIDPIVGTVTNDVPASQRRRNTTP